MICQACGLDKKVVSKKYDFLGKLGIATRNDLSVDVPLQFWVGRARRVTQDTARAYILALTLCLRYAAQRALCAAVAVSFADKQKHRPFGRCFCLVGEAGFGPAKSVTTDLQSAPFGRSGIPPYLILELVNGVEPSTC